MTSVLKHRFHKRTGTSPTFILVGSAPFGSVGADLPDGRNANSAMSSPGDSFGIRNMNKEYYQRSI